MDEKLLAILDNARNAGADEAQLQGIIESYNSKKKSGGTDLNNGTPPISQSKSGSNSGFSLDPVAAIQNNSNTPTLQPQPRQRTPTAEQKAGEDWRKLNMQKRFPLANFSQDILFLPNQVDGEFRQVQIDKRTIPVSPIKAKNDPFNFIYDLNVKIRNGEPLTAQEDAFVKKNVTPVSQFSIDDENELQSIATSNGIALEPQKQTTALSPLSSVPSYGEITSTPEGKYDLISALKTKLQSDIEEELRTENPDKFTRKEDSKKVVENKRQIEELELLQKKLSRQLTKVAENEIQANVRTDESGSIWNRFTEFVKDYATIGTAIFSDKDNTVKDKVEALPKEFMTGLNYLKYQEPVVAERIARSIAKGEPISASQVAEITHYGLDIEKERLEDKSREGSIDAETFEREKADIDTRAYENLIGNKEAARSFFSSQIAEVLDSYNVMNDAKPNALLGNKFFGHKWNYSDEEIAGAAEVVARTNGIDINDARVKEIVKYLQDNEGAMIMQNSISKAGWTRDFFKGAAQPLRGIAAFVETPFTTDAEQYAEGQSQGNVNISEMPVKRLQGGVEGAVSKVMEGAGQLASQIGLSYALSGASGLAGTAILGRAGTAALAGDIAVADMGAANLVGRTLLNSKDAIATFITSYATTYDGYKKTAMNYTADDDKATAVAGGLSTLEGMVENFLSPLDIARGVAGRLINKPSVSKGLISIIDDVAVVDKRAAIKNLISSTLKATGESSKIAASEIGEEAVTQIADFTANAILNPDSGSYQNRDLMEELGNTAYQTGLSMVIPALIGGGSAYNANSFSKGSLMVAAQNTQHFIDDMQARLAKGEMQQEEYNAKVSLINTAQVVNEKLPLKANGEKLGVDEKADYIFSRVSEAVLDKKLKESDDKAEQQIINEKIAEQQNFRKQILTNEVPIIETQNAEAQNLQGQETQTNDNQNATDATNTESIVADEATVQLVKDNVGDVTGFVYPNVIKDASPETITAVLKEASDQWHDTGSRNVAVKTFGQNIIDAAIKMFPQQENNGISVPADDVSLTEEDTISLGELIDKPVTYKGQPATIIMDGQTLVAQINGTNREYELGNVDEVGTASIKDFGIEQEQTVVGVNDSGEITVRDTPYVNNFSQPLQAINYDDNGNFLSVNLETSDGKKRTFRGNIAEDIAYQISLKEINKDNETRQGFEDFATNDATVSAEINDAENAVATQTEADANNAEVSRTAAERNFSNEIISDEAYNSFIDKNIVDDAVLSSIANKVKNRQQLSERENAIFVGKTSEINSIIKNDTNATAAVTEPIQQNEPASQEQGNQEAVQQSANPVSGGNGQATPTVQRVEGVNSIEPVLEGGRAVVTLSGLTENERQEIIAQRKKSDNASPKLIDEQAILDAISSFNKLPNGRLGKTAPVGLRAANNIRNRIATFNTTYNQNYRFDDRAGTLKGNTNKKIKTVTIDGDKQIIEGVVLRDRSDKTKQVFEDLFEANAMPTGYTVYGVRMSDAQLDNTVQDILDGIPSRRAINYLDNLEKQIAANDFDYSDSANPLSNKSSDTTLEFILGIEPEVVGADFTEENLTAWLNEQSEFTPEQEQLVTDNFENLITEYEQERNVAEVPIPATQTETRVDSQDEQNSSSSKATKQNPARSKPEKVSGAESLASKIRGLKVDLSKLSGGGLQSNPLGLPVAVWNSAMDIIATTVEAGGLLGDAIKRGLNYIQRNHRGAWDKKKFNDEVLNELGVRGISVNGEDLVVKDVDREFAETVNGFYSDLEQQILDSKNNTATAKDWAKEIGNSEEAKWTGLQAWLAQQQGQVSKSDIQQFLKDNRVSVVEVVKSDEPIKNTKEYIDLNERTIDAFMKVNEARNKWYETNKDEDFDKIAERQKEAEKLSEKLSKLEKEESTPLVKFSNYQLEGQKENYKEILVTMPEREGRTMQVDEDGVPTNDPAYKTVGRFKSSHFDESNILVHLRMNNRTDSDGNKVLFLEEVQSDWGQKGKKEGFVPDKLTTEKNFIDYRTELYGKYNVEKLADLRKVGDKQELATLETLFANEESTPNPLVQPAPFVTDTNSWAKLGLKVALQQAVNEGADKIAWTNGEQQNERYDLSKQVDKIDVEAVEDVDGLFFVDIKLATGGTENLEVENGIIREGNYQGQRLDAVIGKDYADKVLSTPKGSNVSLQGNDLKVGGKGMKGFYGSPSDGSLGIVGNVAKSLFKQEPKTTVINSRGKVSELIESNPGIAWNVKGTETYIIEGGYDFIVQTGDVESIYPTFEKAKEAAFAKANSFASVQHSIDVTPELVQEVQGGLPLFKDIKGRGKEFAELLRKGKIKSVGLQSNIAGLPIAIWNSAIETIALSIEGGSTLVDAINKAIRKHKLKGFKDFNQADFSGMLESLIGETVIDSNNEFGQDSGSANSELTAEQAADEIKKGNLDYNDATENKSEKYIDDLNKSLFGSDKVNFDADAFKAQARKQKQFGLTEAEANEVLGAAKKLTKKQKAMIAEVYGETAETDKIANELKEAFASIAKGEKPKSVLQRLSVSNVTALVDALKNALTYQAVSNKQLEEMADFIVASIDLTRADAYINALVDNAAADVRQLLRAKVIVELQKNGRSELATNLIRQMADEATVAGRQTQSLVKAYEILGAQGNPATRTEFQRRFADAVQAKAMKLNTHMAEIISNKDVEIGRLNEQIHRDTQKSSSISKIKDVIARLCGLRNKK